MKVKVTFLKIHIVKQKFDDARLEEESGEMKAEVFFVPSINGRKLPTSSVVVSQSHGSKFMLDDFLFEVSKNDVLVNSNKFRKALEKYYRGLIGPKGTLLQILDAENVIVEDLNLESEKSYTFDL